MSILKIIKYNNPLLRMQTKEVHKITLKINKLINDMIDTMYAENGVGLAAPQVGENYKIFIIDVSKQNEPKNPIVFINPKIIKKSGAMSSNEGCLSFPDVYTDVKRFSGIVVKAKNKIGKDFILEATEGDLLTRAIQHEFDHLNGLLFVDHSRNIEKTNKQLNAQGLPCIDMNYYIQEKELEKQINEISLKEEINESLL